MAQHVVAGVGDSVKGLMAHFKRAEGMGDGVRGTSCTSETAEGIGTALMAHRMFLRGRR